MSEKKRGSVEDFLCLSHRSQSFSLSITQHAFEPKRMDTLE